MCIYIYIYIYTHTVYTVLHPRDIPRPNSEIPASWLCPVAVHRCHVQDDEDMHGWEEQHRPQRLHNFPPSGGENLGNPKKMWVCERWTITMEPSGCWWECEIDKKRSLAWFDHQQKAHESTKEGIRTQPEDKILIWVNWYPKNRRVHSKNDNFKASKSSIFQWWRIPHVGSKNPPETRGIIGIGSNKIFGANNSIWMSCLGNFGRRKHMCIYIYYIYIY